MTTHDLDLQCELIELAASRSDDALWATAALLAAGSALLSQALGSSTEAGEAIHAVVTQVVSKARH